MKISAKEQYGLRAVAELAARHGDGPVSLNEVAQAQGVSLAYLEQIVPLLRDAGLIVSTRGAKGGYELARSPQNMTVGDVLRALEGDILPVLCVQHDDDMRPCERIGTCAARAVWQQVHDRVTETLDRMWLADLSTE
ncbi:MAG: Rrf2 family transcriptional regulator [Anaerolineae bacterium]|nr:Rrf2 family transcriptional regulator [Anaerolineae bacterium]